MIKIVRGHGGFGPGKSCSDQTPEAKPLPRNIEAITIQEWQDAVAETCRIEEIPKGYITLNEAADILGMNKRRALYHLVKLFNNGTVERRRVALPASDGHLRMSTVYRIKPVPKK